MAEYDSDLDIEEKDEEILVNPYEFIIPMDLLIMSENKCSGCDYAVYWYIREWNRHNKRQPEFHQSKGVSRHDIAESTGYTVKAVSKSINRLKDIGVAIPNSEETRRYYQIGFQLPYLNERKND